MKVKTCIVGGSGYVGGELIRLLLQHPKVEVCQVTSESRAGKYVTQVHPNLRKRTDLKFSSMQDLRACDLLFVALPHGKSVEFIEYFKTLSPRIIDLSADFRLKDSSAYPQWYGYEHPHPELLQEFVYGIPELHREDIRTASLVSGAGCLATLVILALAPLFRRGLIREDLCIAEGKLGSSAGGSHPSLASHHPERSGVVRSYEPTTHRHTAEIRQELAFPNQPKIMLTATAVEMIRGILSTSHVFLKEDLEEKAIWKAYREDYGSEPFIRIVKDRQGVYRYPEPKLLAGSNFCDIGFERDPNSDRLVVISAIDNLMKGAAGTAVQSMNIMFDFDETTALEFTGLHP